MVTNNDLKQIDDDKIKTTCIECGKEFEANSLYHLGLIMVKRLPTCSDCVRNILKNETL